jgi:FAD/FMN-containing dehydrogenase
MGEDAIVSALREAIGAPAVCTDRDILLLLARDALHPERFAETGQIVQPLCVVRAQHTQAVATVLRLANVYNTPVIPVGGGSGLMGGAASVTPGVVLDLRQLQEIHIRPADRMADVGAGVTIAALNQAAATHGLMCGHDPWTVAVATVGGTLSTNSLGYLGGKYGAMGYQALGLEVVLPSGEIVHTRAVEKTSTGPTLHSLFIGAEGCFGIITRATLRLFPLPQERLLQAWRFDHFAAGFAAINALFDMGLRPGLLDYGDQNPTAAHDTPAALFVSYEGPRRVAQAEAQEASAICKHYQGRRLPQHEAQAFWEERHAIGDAYAATRASGKPWQRPRPQLDYLHVALPPSAVLSYRRQSLERLGHDGCQAHQTGLWNHAGLFSLVYSGKERAMLTETHRELLMLCQDLHGSMEYCHGVGVRLAALMEREHGKGIEVLRRLKHSLDPGGILNPGKLALAAGRMGQETAPEARQA